MEDRFVDVTERQVENFDADKSGIGKKAEFQAKVDGELQYTLLSSFPVRFSTNSDSSYAT